WPSAPGSRSRSDDLLPALEYLAPSGAFVSTDLGVGWNLVPLLAGAEAARTWQVGARLWPQFGRPSRFTPNGIDRLGPRVTTEAFANVQARRGCCCNRACPGAAHVITTGSCWSSASPPASPSATT
ncbi:hypothetical protein, partial [Mitsuaria sp. TWR114]|uniref:hypothetical protein n=1 Tax=Mitsuaria sp. TWR114 TaxID=2601731 RepID=UPI00164B7488